MRTGLKIAGWAAAGVAAVALVVVITVYVASNARLQKSYAVAVRPLTIPADAEAIAHGRHIAGTRGCVDCHGPDFGGAKVMDDGAMGRVYGTNLTPGRGSATTGYSDEDWIRAIRHGVGRTGRGLFVMPSDEYAHFSDVDLGSVIAFLKVLPPVDRERVPIQPGPVTRLLLTLDKMKLAAENIDHANVRPVSVSKGPTVDYGRYLANSCTGCHGPNFSGGKIEIGPPNWPPARNLTPHTSGELLQWDEMDFVRAMRLGQRPDGTAIDPVMPRSFAGMDDVELRALWLFFKSVPPVPTGVR